MAEKHWLEEVFKWLLFLQAGIFIIVNLIAFVFLAKDVAKTMLGLGAVDEENSGLREKVNRIRDSDYLTISGKLSVWLFVTSIATAVLW